MIKTQLVKQNVLYIHGFNSSPLSLKAEQTRFFLSRHYPQIGFYCPQLATTPEAAIEQLEYLINQQPKTYQWLVMGSSLGGYFAHYLAEKYQLSAVLINPAVKPYELLNDYLGEQQNPYTQENYQVNLTYIAQLKAIEKASPTRENTRKNNYLIMVQTGDEVLDYQQSIEKYKHCRLLVEEGGDHSFVGYQEKLPAIADFFQLK